MRILRGDLYYADLAPVIGCEQGGVRPVLIIQNDVGNLHSPTVIVAAVTSKISKHNLPTHVPLPNYGGLKAYSIILLEQIRTIDRSRLKEYIGHLDLEIMKSVDRAIAVSLGLG
ncbi:type II toxin-antitoxin system PemK/MazF family toxin [Hungatella effluvii]|uniref:type II toxin-antitoxin system PemK/MazF family toxin n=1 Tax=Hungatella effluvii TaxID=1096246 RepID=UPI0022E3045C|nr:type II toxin-antitoxin system PemK/MazF family toxin [Hungatella effluvii]